MGRLIKEALYHQGDFDVHIQREADYANALGDERKLHYLEETFGVKPFTDDDFSKIIDKIRKEDPYGIRTLALHNLETAEESGDKDKIRIAKIAYNRCLEIIPVTEYRKWLKLKGSKSESVETEGLPITSRPTSFACRDIVSLVLTGKGYFDSSLARRKVDEWLGIKDS
jgi:hypothetical protein